LGPIEAQCAAKRKKKKANGVSVGKKDMGKKSDQINKGPFARKG